VIAAIHRAPTDPAAAGENRGEASLHLPPERIDVRPGTASRTASCSRAERYSFAAAEAAVAEVAQPDRRLISPW
jgi:hypothetical protein